MDEKTKHTHTLSLTHTHNTHTHTHTHTHTRTHTPTHTHTHTPTHTNSAHSLCCLNEETMDGVKLSRVVNLGDTAGSPTGQPTNKPSTLTLHSRHCYNTVNTASHTMSAIRPTLQTHPHSNQRQTPQSRHRAVHW